MGSWAEVSWPSLDKGKRIGKGALGRGFEKERGRLEFCVEVGEIRMGGGHNFFCITIFVMKF